MLTDVSIRYLPYPLFDLSSGRSTIYPLCRRHGTTAVGSSSGRENKLSLLALHVWRISCIKLHATYVPTIYTYLNIHTYTIISMLHTHTYIHTHIHTHTYSTSHTYMYYIHIHTHTYVYIHTYIGYIHTYIETYTYIHTYTHIHTYVYIYVHT